MDEQILLMEFRKKLVKSGRTRKWWHREYIPNLYKYNYFIRQINIPDTLKPDLAEVIEKYVEDNHG